MEEEPDRLHDPEPTQFLADRNQVVIVHPDYIARLQQVLQGLGKLHVDAAIGVVGFAGEVHQVQPVMA
jgi:hypothetical protein